MADAVAKKNGNLFKKLVSYLKELKSELKKIVWPTKAQVLNNTLIVIAAILVIGACIWAIDSLLGLGMFALFGN